MTTRHRWYTLSGIIVRIINAASMHLFNTDLAFTAAFIFGAVELYGIKKTVRLIKRARKLNLDAPVTKSKQ